MSTGKRDPHAEFRAERDAEIARQGKDDALRDASVRWMLDTSRYNYTYNFTWMGRPIIQFPQDIVAMQEILWTVRPDLVIETGIARGGSLIFYASMLELIGRGEVLGVDVDIRAHNREAIEAHPMARRIRMIQGSSVDPAVVAQVREHARGKRVLVTLDSNHTHEHVLAELQAYAPLVSKGSYLVVFDTSIADAPEGFFAGKPWSRTDNPMTAVHAYLATTKRFEIDRAISDKLLVTVARDGYLRCVAD
jgi:cephalosporin hydroxylase